MFTPEFRNRLDAVISFSALTPRDDRPRRRQVHPPIGGSARRPQRARSILDDGGAPMARREGLRQALRRAAAGPRHPGARQEAAGRGAVVRQARQGRRGQGFGRQGDGQARLRLSRKAPARRGRRAPRNPRRPRSPNTWSRVEPQSGSTQRPHPEPVEGSRTPQFTEIAVGRKAALGAAFLLATLQFDRASFDGSASLSLSLALRMRKEREGHQPKMPQKFSPRPKPAKAAVAFRLPASRFPGKPHRHVQKRQ